jgi:hypothetical protein
LCRLSLLAVVGDDPSLHDPLDTVTEALRELKDVNNLCQYSLDVEEPGVDDQMLTDLLLPVSGSKDMMKR